MKRYAIGMVLRALVVVGATALLCSCGTMRGPMSDIPHPPGVDMEEAQRSMRDQERTERPGFMQRIASLFSREKPKARMVYRGEEASPEPSGGETRGPAQVSAMSATRLSPAEVTDFTVAAWIRCNALPSSARGFAGIVGKYDPAKPEESEWLMGLKSTGKLFLRTTGSGSPLELEAKNAVTLGKWFHVCGHWHAEGGVTLYVNGAQSAQGALTKPSNGDLTLFLGDTSPADGAHAFVGNIDEVKVWAKAATLDFVKRQYGMVPDADGDGTMDGEDTDDDGDRIPDEWEAKYFKDRLAGGPNDDGDKDGYNNLAEFISGTDPTDGASVFGVDGVDLVDPGDGEVNSDHVLTCKGVAGRVYQAWVAPDLTKNRKEWTKVGAPVDCTKTGTLQIVIPKDDTQASRFYYIAVSMREEDYE